MADGDGPLLLRRNVLGQRSSEVQWSARLGCPPLPIPVDGWQGAEHLSRGQGVTHTVQVLRVLHHGMVVWQRWLPFGLPVEVAVVHFTLPLDASFLTGGGRCVPGPCHNLLSRGSTGKPSCWQGAHFFLEDCPCHRERHWLASGIHSLSGLLRSFLEGDPSLGGN